MTDSGIWTRHFWLPSHGDTPHICIVQATNDSADGSPRLGENRKREKTPTTELTIFLSKFFLKEIKYSIRKKSTSQKTKR